MNREEKIEVLTQSICGKPPATSPQDCHATLGATNPLCNEYSICRIDQKSDEQLDYVLSSIENCVFLKACPGSGKTEVVGLKAAYEMSKWRKTPGGIGVLTFTNNAAEVIGKRVSQFGGVVKIGFPHFIGTIDSWLHGYIAHPYAYHITGYNGKNQDHSIRLVDAASAGRWLHAYKLDTPFITSGHQPMPLYANNIQWDPEERIWNILIPGPRNMPLKDCDYYDSPAFSQFRKDKDWLTLDYMRRGFLKKKKAFMRDGFATYQDIECICYKLLSDRPELARLLSLRFPFIIVDECQDLSWIQIQILDKIRSQGTSLHFIGDLNQAIYEFKKVEPEKVKEYTQEHKFNVLSLSKNYRNCQQISNLCDDLVGNSNRAMSINASELDSPCVCVIFKECEIMKLPRWFNNYLDQFKIDKKWSVIVTRSWKNVSRMRPSDSGKIEKYQERLAIAIHLWKTGCRQTIGDALKLFGHFISEKFFLNESIRFREFYKPESVDSALEWRLFLAAALSECCQDEKLSNLEQTWKDWAKVVRDRLHKHLSKSVINFSASLPNHDFLPLKAMRAQGTSSPVFKSPSGRSDNKVLESLQPNTSVQEHLRITTIHNIKGETMDALMLVSSQKRGGTGHWTKWLSDPTSEAARLAYVASSRPRKLIIWAIPHPSEMETDQLNRLKKIGFKVQHLDSAPAMSQTELTPFFK